MIQVDYHKKGNKSRQFSTIIPTPVIMYVNKFIRPCGSIAETELSNGTRVKNKGEQIL